jgi:hypothetical protein
VISKKENTGSIIFGSGGLLSAHIGYLLFRPFKPMLHLSTRINHFVRYTGEIRLVILIDGLSLCVDLPYGIVLDSRLSLLNL